MTRYLVINYHTGEKVATFDTAAELVNALLYTNDFWFPIEIRDLHNDKRISRKELNDIISAVKNNK